MSKEITSQKLQQKCEGCGTVVEWELVGADDHPNILAEMQEWYIVGRKVVAPNGQLTSLSADACSLACVPAAAVKLALPKFEEPEDTIDLASLRANIN